ncbi:uncharacterized protein [Diabrotica undecimpunctata]|uniref:uncharacterized protein n=1 Tax=Diabrotica undecimpunctata TaxID=50387 RepID=UPI003B63DCA0
MAKVYFWKMTTEGVGHLSLQLSDGTYISHWPKNTSGLKKPGTSQPSLETDIDLENRYPDETYTIDKSGIIDESKIRSWWNSYKSSSSYNLVTNNCGQVVRTALIQGGIEETLPWHNKIGYYALYPLNTTPAVTPNDILNWIKYVVNLHGSFFKWS